VTLTDALGVVLRDVTVSGLALRILDAPASDDPDVESVWLRGMGGSRTGIVLERGTTAASALVRVADQVQDFLVEEQAARGASTSWPECPVHPGTHPLRPRDTKGGAAWECPRSPQIAFPIGELHRDASG
jgi:hypothetical protein